MVNPKKSQLQKLRGHIQAARESLRSNDEDYTPDIAPASVEPAM